MRITDYQIVHAVSIDELVKEVNEYISKRYKPFGSVAVDNGNFYQAVILYELELAC